MMTTLSADTWTSAYGGYEGHLVAQDANLKIPLSMPSAPSRIAASKLASVFSGNREDALERR